MFPGGAWGRRGELLRGAVAACRAKAPLRRQLHTRRPPPANLVYPPALRPPKGGKGEATDYYLYITTQQDNHCDSGAVAWALPCLYDSATNRPLLVRAGGGGAPLRAGERASRRRQHGIALKPMSLLLHWVYNHFSTSLQARLANHEHKQHAHICVHPQGSANICPNNLEGADPEAAVSVLVHELMHALGFTDDSFDKFVDASGAPVPKDQVVKEITDAFGRWAPEQPTGGCAC